MVKNKNILFHRIAFFATILAFTVVILGAYTRLKDAGLGCPDWPGCYGQLSVPKTAIDIASAQKLYPNQPVETTKAWPEMVHRYFAGTLVLLILTLTILGFRRKNTLKSVFKVTLLLLGCIIFQALLGMWTVTLKLHPLVVMGHLLGGMTIASLLWWSTLKSGSLVNGANHTMNYLKPWLALGIGIVVMQIFLGGWTSANYASIVCPDFPFCQDRLFPHFDFAQAFNFLRPIGLNYQGGVLGVTARVTIQMCHRYGAFITFSYISLLGFYILFSSKTYVLKNTAGMVLLILGSQIFLGILNIATSLYLPIAVTHNAVALTLLLSMITLRYQLTAPIKVAATVTSDLSQIAGEFSS